MFKGHYINVISEKGRVSIPSRFRELMERRGADRLIITKGLDRCLVAFTPDEWERLEEKARHLSMVKMSDIIFKRQVIGSAEECQIDSQGRILIPGALREYGGLKKKCLFLGVTDRFEIWDQDTYNEFMQAALKDHGDLRKELAELGL